MDLPPEPITEKISRAAEKSKVLLTSFLKLPPVKVLQFYLSGGLGIGINFCSIQKNNGLMPLPSVYTLRDENYFRLKLQSRHM